MPLFLTDGRAKEKNTKDWMQEHMEVNAIMTVYSHNERHSHKGIFTPKATKDKAADILGL